MVRYTPILIFSVSRENWHNWVGMSVHHMWIKLCLKKSGGNSFESCKIRGHNKMYNRTQITSTDFSNLNFTCRKWKLLGFLFSGWWKGLDQHHQECKSSTVKHFSITKKQSSKLYLMRGWWGAGTGYPEILWMPQTGLMGHWSAWSRRKCS